MTEVAHNSLHLVSYEDNSITKKLPKTLGTTEGGGPPVSLSLLQRLLY